MGIYTNLEDKWYDFVDYLDQYVPIGNAIDKIDKIIPSFLIALVLFFLLILFFEYYFPAFAILYDPIATKIYASKLLSPLLNIGVSNISSPAIKKKTEAIIAINPYSISLLAINRFRLK